MTRKLIIIAGMALMLAGCGDNDDVATSKPSMMDKADSVTDAVKNTTSDVVEGASDMASDAVDATKEAVHDAAQDIADATADKPTDAETQEALEYMDKEMEQFR